MSKAGNPFSVLASVDEENAQTDVNKKSMNRNKDSKKKQQQQRQTLAPPVTPWMDRPWVEALPTATTTTTTTTTASAAAAGDDGGPSHGRFSVLSYNVLCQAYARSQYFPYCNPRAVQWRHRGGRMVDEILCYDTDIVALQEVDYYDHLKKQLQIRGGYASCYQQRTRGKPDGCAIFWRQSRFDLVHKACIKLNEVALIGQDMLDKDFLTDNVASVAILRYRPQDAVVTGTTNGIKRINKSKRYVCVVNGHLFWNPVYSGVKTEQAYALLEKALHIIENFKQQGHVGRDVDVPLLLCGDFNSMPDSDVYQMITRGSTSITRTPPMLKTTLTTLDKLNVRERHHRNPLATQTEVTSVVSSQSETTGLTKQISNLTINESTATVAESVVDEEDEEDQNVHEIDKFNVRELTTRRECKPFPGDDKKEILTLSHTLPMASSHASVLGREPHYTNYTEGFKGCLDYIFYQSDSLAARAVLEPLSVERMSKNTALPSAKFISDHMAIAAILEFL